MNNKKHTINDTLITKNPRNKFEDFHGADEGSRTPTPRALDPKSSASANFATSAYYIIYYTLNLKFYNTLTN